MNEKLYLAKILAAWSVVLLVLVAMVGVVQVVAGGLTWLVVVDGTVICAGVVLLIKVWRAARFVALERRGC